MSHVHFKKWPCRPAEFSGRRREWDPDHIEWLTKNRYGIYIFFYRNSPCIGHISANVKICHVSYLCVPLFINYWIQYVQV